MMVLSPAWLWLVVPWVGVAAWMLRRRGREVGVPFVELWETARVGSPVRRGLRLPPWGVMALLGALLLAIGAASRPALPAGEAAPFTLIWDRGSAMGGRSAGLAEQLSEVWAAEAGVSRRVTLQVLPGDATIETAIDELPSLLRTMTPTALETRDLVAAAAAAALRRTDQPVVVVTPHAIPMDDPRLMVIHPPPAEGNVAIADFAYRDSPYPRAMVRVENQSALTEARLRVRGGEGAREHAIELPGKGEARRYFLEVAGDAGEVMAAELVVDDAWDQDNRAWLVRAGVWPRIEVVDPQPAAIERVIAVYQAARPAGPDAPRVLISRQPLPAGARGVVIPSATRTIAAGGIAMGDHPVLENVLLEGGSELRIATSQPPEGFEVILSADDQPLIAVSDAEGGQVWIGMETAAFADQPAFVVLWANVLGWAGGDGVRYVSQPSRTLGEGWQRIEPDRLPDDVQAGWVTGVYRTEEGEMAAIHAPADEGDAAVEAGGADWRLAMSEILMEGRGARVLSAWLVIGALVLAGLAALWWPAVGLTRPYRRRTVPTDPETRRDPW